MSCHDQPELEPELQCELCGLDPSDCICPECPQCRATGDPLCYDEHGLTLSPGQRLAAEERDRRRVILADSLYYASLPDDFYEMGDY